MRTAACFLEGCRRRGVDTSRILSRIGVPRRALADPNGRFPIERVGVLLGTISSTLGDETLGFLERPTAPGGLEMWIHACITSRTLHEAIRRWIRYWSLIHADQRTELSVHGDEARLRTAFPPDPGFDRTGLITWEMFLMLRLASWLIGKPLLLDRLHFTFAEPADPGDYEALFPARHHFDDSENCVVFNQRFLDMPVVRTPADVPEFVRNLPHLLQVQWADRSLTAQVRRMLTATECVTELTLRDVARRFNRSESTVARRLRREGSSLSEIRESVRRDVAVYHLQCLDTPIGRITDLLGFSEPSAFTRAFKRWTGRTPGNFRRQP